MSRKVNSLFKNLRDRITTPELLGRVVSANYNIELREYRDWLINSKILSTIECLPHKHVTIIEYDDEFYIVIPDISHDSTIFCSDIETNIFNDSLLLREQPGLKFFIWSQLNGYNQIETDEENLLLKVFMQPENNKFEICDLEEFFIPFEIYKLNKDRIIYIYNDKESLSQICFKVYGLFLCEYNHLLSLNIRDQDLITNIKTTFELHGDIISMPIFRGVTSTNFEHLFLEFYRCIERLYGYPVIKSFIEAIDSSNIQPIDFDDIISKNEKHYDVRPNELSALTSLLKNHECSLLVNEFAINYSIDSTNNKIENIAKKIYKKRNNIAHWRKALDEDSIKVDELLIKTISSFIICLYNIYGSYLRVAVTAPRSAVAPASVESI